MLSSFAYLGLAARFIEGRISGKMSTTTSGAKLGCECLSPVTEVTPPPPGDGGGEGTAEDFCPASTMVHETDVGYHFCAL